MLPYSYLLVLLDSLLWVFIDPTFALSAMKTAKVIIWAVAYDLPPYLPGWLVVVLNSYNTVINIDDDDLELVRSSDRPTVRQKMHKNTAKMHQKCLVLRLIFNGSELASDYCSPEAGRRT